MLCLRRKSYSVYSSCKCESLAPKWTLRDNRLRWGITYFFVVRRAMTSIKSCRTFSAVVRIAYSEVWWLIMIDRPRDEKKTGCPKRMKTFSFSWDGVRLRRDPVYCFSFSSLWNQSNIMDACAHRMNFTCFDASWYLWAWMSCVKLMRLKLAVRQFEDELSCLVLSFRWLGSSMFLSKDSSLR